MNLNVTLKKIICFLLAVLMLLGTVACKDTGGKRKVIKKKKKKVIVVNPDTPADNNNSSIIVEDDGDVEEEQVRPKRRLPEVAEVKEKYVEPIIPEFDYEYKELNLTDDYVIVYSFEKWENRFESKIEGKYDRPINETAFCRIAANDLATYFNEKCGLELEVVRDTDPKAQTATKKILVGDTAYYKTSLADNEFAVNIVDGNIIFEGGHFAMVEKAVDWFRTVKIEEGKVATLSGKQDDFATTKLVKVRQKDGTVKEIVYDYVWGDEFDGAEFNDYDKWAQGTFGLERQDDMLNIFDDPQFQYVENGRLRLTGDRYYDEGNPAIGYATSGQIDTDGKMLFRNGYMEFRARLPYTRGGFPAIWTMTADAMGQENLPNYDYDDGYGLYKERVWDLEFDLFESFADEEHMTTTIHKWYTPRYNTTFASDPIDLTLEEEKMVEEDRKAVKEKNGQWVYDTPLVKTEPDAEDSTKSVNVYYYVENNDKVYVSMNAINEENDKILDGKIYVVKEGEQAPTDLKEGVVCMAEKDTWQYKLDEGILKQAHVRYKIIMNVKQSDNTTKPVDIFQYRLSPFTNMSKSMNTYAYQFSYYGSKGSGASIRRADENGIYADWRWYFDKETINNEYHLYALHVTPERCTVYMDGTEFLDFDWDPAYDYKDLDGDGKGDDISNNNNGVGFNFWQYFLIDMMIYTPNNFTIDAKRKLQAGDLPLHLYIDYVRCYQDLDDNSQCIYYPNGEAN